MAKKCKHRWSPYTIHKAKCVKCKLAVPWVDLAATTASLAVWLVKRSKEHATHAKHLARGGHYAEAAEVDAMASAYAFAALHVERLSK